MNPSLTLLCPLWHGPNGKMASYLYINIFIPVRSVGIMVIMSRTTILLFHGDVPFVAILIS
jgi:hypothetical protein